MKDERDTVSRHFILHPPAFTLPPAGMLFVAREREGL
jgi:hypothetical protein